MGLEERKNIEKIRWSAIVSILGALLLLSILSIPQVTATSYIFHENFTTTTYRGTASNVTNWGTGEINIRREQIIHTDTVAVPGPAHQEVYVQGDIAYLAQEMSRIHPVLHCQMVHGYGELHQ
ncbi:MAG: hypothetical protein ACTSSE_12810 [Candidatus Thorarchaeota archaeon]